MDLTGSDLRRALRRTYRDSLLNDLTQLAHSFPTPGWITVFAPSGFAIERQGLYSLAE